MKTDLENNEWKAEAPYLASLPVENPFLVPEHYFDTLPEAITQSVYTNELKQVIPASGYTVPDQYFSSLKERILKQIINETSATDRHFLRNEKLNVNEENISDDSDFSESELADFGLEIHELSEYELLELGLEKYDLQESELNQDIDKVASLRSLPGSAGFSTPEHYFQNLQSRILAKTAEAAAPVVKQSKIVRLWHSGLLKYASAACFVLVAAFGFYLNQQVYEPEASTAAEIANEQMLYDIDEQDIIDHVEGNVVDAPKNNATDAELETYILNNYSQTDLSSEL